MEIVKENDQVSVHYTGTLDNGEVFDSSKGREPLAFVVGAGQMIAGFDEAVEGMKLNEVKKVRMEASQAYGEVNEDMIQKIDRKQLPEDLKPAVGQQLVSQSPDGHEMVVTVTASDEDSITIDANHPLAGKALTFEIELVSIN